MSIVERFTHSEEIESLLTEAQQMYDDAKNKMEEQKKKTTSSLEQLGRLKVSAWANEMTSFVEAFSVFKNLEVINLENKDLDYLGTHEKPQELMINMKNASLTAKEVVQTGLLAAGTGALVGIASYGGAMMFAHASTGAAISSLSGVAKTNATLAWLGGGTLKEGGFGVLGGKVVLAGVVILPILALSGIITAAKSKKRLAEAKKVHAEAENAVIEIDTITTGLSGIQALSDNYFRFIQQFEERFKPFVDELNRIRASYRVGDDGKIDFNWLTDVEQKTVHLAWLLGELHYHILAVTLLTPDGTISDEANRTLSSAETSLVTLNREIDNLNAEKAEIKRLLHASNTSFTGALQALENQRKATLGKITSLFRSKLGCWSRGIYSYIEALQFFENVDLEMPAFVTEHVNLEDEQLASDMKTMSQVSNTILAYGIKNLSQALIVDFAVCNGPDMCCSIGYSDSIITNLSTAQRTDAAKWISGEKSSFSYIGGIPLGKISHTQARLNSITGRENLAVAQSIYTAVSGVTERVNTSTQSLKKVCSAIESYQARIKQFSRFLKPYTKELEQIRLQHTGSDEACVIDFDSLSNSEKHLIGHSWQVAKTLYYVLVMPLFNSDGSTVINLTYPIDYSEQFIKSVKRQTFKMKGDEQRAADIVWKPYAHSAYILNAISVACFIAAGVWALVSKNYKGIIPLVGAVIAFPAFFFLQRMPESKKMLVRLIRLVVAVVCVTIALILL